MPLPTGSLQDTSNICQSLKTQAPYKLLLIESTFISMGLHEAHKYLITFNAMCNRQAKGIWRKSGDRPVGVDWHERVINICEGGWTYVAGATGYSSGM